MNNNKIIRYGALCYDNSYNLGDNIQTLAAEQYFKNIDFWVDRDSNKIYTKEYILLSKEELDLLFEKYIIKVIYNGWFHEKYFKIDLHSIIDPLFISFHLNDDDHLNDKRYRAIDKFQIGQSAEQSDMIKYFKQKCIRVGCRDLYTFDKLKKSGVDCYFSACLTLNLQKNNFTDKKNENKRIKILVIDAHIECFELLEEYLKMNNIDKKDIIYKTQALEKLLSNNEKLKLSFDFLTDIANSCLVITSRLHTALPCIAFQVPFVFLHTEKKNDIRFKGLIDLYINPKIFLKNINFNDIKKNWDDILYQNLYLYNLRSDKNDIIINEFLKNTENRELKLMQKFKHYRNGKIYTIIGFGYSVDLDEEVVIYQDIECQVWVRMKKKFNESVVYNENLVNRFELLLL